jgi:hypothetical protein
MGADQRDRLARLHAQRDAPQRQPLTEALRALAQLHDGRRHAPQATVSHVRPHHVPFAVLATALAICTASACGEDAQAPPSTTAASGPSTLHVEYDSGSIAPPWNHELVLDLRVAPQQVEGDYRLTYRYRSAAQPLPAGADEDLAWSGALEGPAADDARSLVARPDLTGHEPTGVGGHSWSVEIVGPDGTARTGVPEDEDPWHSLACAVDAQARRALGRNGAAQSC